MGKDGWLTLGWPKEYGGQGKGAVEQFIFWDETYRARAPLPLITVNTVGPMLMQYGSEAQKAEFLPRIRDGELLVGIGYTEPGAGTDLASLQTRAVRDGDEWVINGQKVFTTHAEDADYIWLAARTDPDAPKHKGISIMLVPTDTPGFSCTPIRTIGGEITNVTYYQDVRVPVSSRVGPENAGWGLITDQLNLERITLAMPGPADRLLEEVWTWAAKIDAPGGGRMIDQPWVQQNLARVYAKLEGLKLLNWRSAWLIDQGRPAMADASAVKVMGTELLIECYRLLLEITGVGRAAAARGAGSAVRRPPGVRLPGRDGQHLRRRRERGAARHHRHGRPRAAARTALGEIQHAFDRGAEARPRSRDARVRGEADRPALRRARSREPADDPPVVRRDGRPQPRLRGGGGRAWRRPPCCRPGPCRASRWRRATTSPATTSTASTSC